MAENEHRKVLDELWRVRWRPGRLTHTKFFQTQNEALAYQDTVLEEGGEVLSLKKLSCTERELLRQPCERPTPQEADDVNC